MTNEIETTVTKSEKRNQMIADFSAQARDAQMTATNINPQQIGERIGKAIARDTLADGLDREWSGLTAADADQLAAAGIEPHSDDWDAAIEAARLAYLAEVA